jgi:type IV pilus assembly protein PilB
VSVPAPRRAREERRLLGDLLIESGLVSRDGLRSALDAQGLAGGRLGWHLVRMGNVVPAAFHMFLEEHLEALRPDLVEGVLGGEAAGLLPARLAHHYGMVPVRETGDGVLEIAMAGADEPRLGPALRALTGLRIEPVICPPSLIGAALARHYPAEIEPGVAFRPFADNLLVVAETRRRLRPRDLVDLGAASPSAEWLRSIVAEALRHGARRIEIEPRSEWVDLIVTGSEGRCHPVALPRGSYAGIAALIEGLARIGARGKLLPREGRFLVEDRGRRVLVSVLALPGLEGRLYVLDLREERVAGPTAADLSATLPGLREAIDALAAAGRGLLVVAVPGPSEWASALDAILALLGGRLARRAVEGGWDEPLHAHASAPGGAELLVVASPWREGDGAAIGAAAADRAVIATMDAPDVFAAAETIARRTSGMGTAAAAPLGVLAVRHLEALCPACRVNWDPPDLPQPAGGDPAFAGPFAIASGCASCRGSGRIEMIRVAEFLPGVPGGLARPGVVARRLREEHVSRGRPTLAHQAMLAAAAGRLDAREVLRLLLHEPR